MTSSRRSTWAGCRLSRWESVIKLSTTAVLPARLLPNVCPKCVGVVEDAATHPNRLNFTGVGHVIKRACGDPESLGGFLSREKQIYTLWSFFASKGCNLLTELFHLVSYFVYELPELSQKVVIRRRGVAVLLSIGFHKST